ncbi:hypothetical protein E2562_018054 [Oryza meyeriana var. granulata]|uniref:Uncharacterized protein n=1 Tax=Oryza meyeriana var. granulata TaxID=110450 RepID=A0A6G1CQ09_9ORYZ|nr:hypothetical protein E2562_018054 [Oryza meyeriana var. granulata]
MADLLVIGGWNGFRGLLLLQLTPGADSFAAAGLRSVESVVDAGRFMAPFAVLLQRLAEEVEADGAGTGTSGF